jgi:hypothetical protein
MRLFAVSLLAILTASAALADGVTAFRTPSGNIHCMLIEGDEGMLVDCEMREISNFTLKQKRPADCDLDWGNRFSLAAEGKPLMGCYGDTVQDPSSRVLDYGQSIGNELLNCVSRQSGLTCENQSGHGFLLSKAKQRFY